MNKDTIISFVLGATLASGVAVTTDLVKEEPIADVAPDVMTVEATPEVQETVLTKHPEISHDRVECEKTGGSLKVTQTTKYQNTPTTTEPLEDIVLECVK